MKTIKFNLQNANGTYYSFQDFARATGRETAKKRTSDEQKLQAQKEKFVGKCKVCGQDLTYRHGTNILACTNANCKGIEMKRKNDDGTESTWYIPVTRLLDTTGMEIAMNLFD